MDNLTAASDLHADPAGDEQPPQASPDRPPAGDPEGPASAGEPGEASSASEKAESMERLLSQQESLEFRPGTFLSGKVVRIDSDGVYVDVGYKTEGLVPPGQISHHPVDPREVLEVGQEIEVVVQRIDSEGTLILSKKRADLEAAWRRVVEAEKSGAILVATCTEQVKGGLIVDLGLRGFVPASHADVRPVHDLSDLVGEPLRLKVLEVDRSRRKVVLSRKKALEEERQRLKKETLANLQEGQIVSGRVARLTDFGAFVNLGGVDGLVHISELSWRRVNHPAEVVQVGQEIEVLVLKVDRKRERISLSYRQATPDPWQTTVRERYHPGDVVKGRVTKLAKKYVFVELSEGVEGLIPLVELADYRVVRPDEVVKPDEVVEVKILEIDPVARRILLSLRQARGRLDYDRQMAREEYGGGFTIGELLKDKRSTPQMQQVLRKEPPSRPGQAEGPAEGRPEEGGAPSAGGTG